MKRFQFSLQKVMEIRQTEEKILQKKHALLQKDLDEAMIARDKIVAEKAGELDSLREMEQGSFNSAMYMVRQKYLQSLQNNIERSGERIADLENKVEAARLQLLEKSRERKSIEKLRETRFEEYKRDAGREEQIFLDEIAVQNAKFRTAGGNS